jgi:hypothetical protein
VETDTSVLLCRINKEKTYKIVVPAKNKMGRRIEFRVSGIVVVKMAGIVPPRANKIL